MVCFMILVFEFVFKVLDRFYVRKREEIKGKIRTRKKGFSIYS